MLSSLRRKTLDLAAVRKVYKHLGRANLRQLSCVLRQAGYVVDQESIIQMLIKCGRNNSRVRSHSSIANAHMSPYPVYAVFMDITYLQKTGHKDPYVMMVDSFSRFLACVPSPSIKPHDIIRCFEVSGCIGLEDLVFLSATQVPVWSATTGMLMLGSTT